MLAEVSPSLQFAEVTLTTDMAQIMTETHTIEAHEIHMIAEDFLIGKPLSQNVPSRTVGAIMWIRCNLILQALIILFDCKHLPGLYLKYQAPITCFCIMRSI